MPLLHNNSTSYY